MVFLSSSIYEFLCQLDLTKIVALSPETTFPVGVKLIGETTSDSPFFGTNCPDPSTPNMSAVPPGPFCYPCNWAKQ